MVSGFPKS